MRQLVLPDSFSGEPEFQLDGEDAHYLVRVLRFGVDDSFPAVDRDGVHYHCTLLSVGEMVRIRVQQKGAPTSSGPSIHICQAIPKGRKLDDVVRRCTEAGVRSLEPVLTDYTVVRLDEDRVSKKLSRWRRIAREAVQQSGAPVPVEVGEPKSLEDWLHARSGKRTEARSLRLVLHQAPLVQASLHRYLAEEVDEIELVIGPEGGLSDRELAFLRDAGYKPVYLGPQVLRTETVALYVTAAVKTILLEKSEWLLKSSSQE